MKNGPIILVEDDVDDQEIITEALQMLHLRNEIVVFDNGKKALDFLLSTVSKPFIIICDVNLPVMNGLLLKHEIKDNEFLHKKSIPFVFLSTSADPQAVIEAYDLSVQGFFVKESSFEGIQRQLKQIVDYWTSCKHPL